MLPAVPMLPMHLVYAWIDARKLRELADTTNVMCVLAADGSISIVDRAEDSAAAVLQAADSQTCRFCEQ